MFIVLLPKVADCVYQGSIISCIPLQRLHPLKSNFQDQIHHNCLSHFGYSITQNVTSNPLVLWQLENTTDAHLTSVCIKDEFQGLWQIVQKYHITVAQGSSLVDMIVPKA